MEKKIKATMLFRNASSERGQVQGLYGLGFRGIHTSFQTIEAAAWEILRVARFSHDRISGPLLS